MHASSFFTEYLNATFLFSMLNDKEDKTYRYVDLTLIKDKQGAILPVRSKD